MLKKKGLKDNQAKELLKEFGLNIVKTKEKTFLERFFKKLIHPITLMIEVALILSIFTHHYEDASIISILLLVNIIIDL